MWEGLTFSWRKAFLLTELQYRFTVAMWECLTFSWDERHFSWQNYSTGLLYVRWSHIFLTKGIFPDRAPVQVYYIMWEGLAFSWWRAFLLTELQYRFTICETVSHFLDELHFSWKSYSTGLLYVRGSHIFLTKGISPDRAAVQIYYMWEGLTFSWRKAFFHTRGGGASGRETTPAYVEQATANHNYMM